MIIKRIVKVIILSILVHKSESECFCTQRGQEVTCNHNLRNQVQLSLKMDISQRLLQNAAPSNNVTKVEIACNVKALQFNTFSNQALLKILNLNKNLISTIPQNFFSTLQDLEELYMSNNKLKNLEYDSFIGLKKLKILNLSFNQISHISNIGVLDDFNQLEELSLNANKISIISEGVFDELVSVKYIDLSDNKLSKIPTVFLHTDNLEQIILNNNPLQDNDALTGLQNLNQIKILQLSGCNIQNAQLKPLTNTKHLQQLDLSNNNLQYLSPDTFALLTKLQNVSLQNCRLSSLHLHTFEHNVHLRILDLSSNLLLTLPDGLFNKTSVLQYFNISHNYIDRIPVSLFQYTDLIEIDMSYNHLDTIEPDLLNMETLTNVIAHNNKITHLEDLTFASCNYPIRYLNLANNRLVFLGEYFFDWLANLERIEIYGNPWDCKCLEELQILLNNRFIDYDQTIYSDGKIPICVSGSTTICNYDDSNLTHYYDVYMNSINQ